MLLALSIGTALAHGESLDYARDIQPILSTHCFACHGPDESHRKGELRLDVESEAKRMRDGLVPVKPGDPAGSAILERILSHDPDEVMPPPKSGKKPTPEEVQKLRQWVSEGAPWGVHWAFERVSRPPGTLDDQVRKGLSVKKLELRPRADWARLVRRLALDLTGLPPRPEWIARAQQAGSEEDYRSLVDELLASPQFGEHWARMWLDLARYADTKGYEKDLGRSMWPYRDWVVDAFNADMPLDQFTREQLAGDLLPNPSLSQRIATAFHRNTMANDEGGTDDEEFRVAAVKDRVDTTIQVWMGLTMGCAKCHSHKYDPISIQDYYAVYGVFNQTEDADRHDDAPRLAMPKPGQEEAKAAAIQRVEDLRTELARLSGREKTAKGFESPDPDDSPGVMDLKTKLKAAREEQRQVEEQIVALPIMRELQKPKQRATRIHQRGNFLDPGEPVEASVLNGFAPKPDGWVDRLKLADWLMHTENPLTARVWANRIWARLFGIGIVETEEDFGLQGSLPSNPALLDWLAAEYRDGGWSLKGLLRSIVVSETYRQRSELNPALQEQDPSNRLASRGARFRLPAEVIRDQALAVSGLLSAKRGGPSVMPPQPAGLWRSAYSGKDWVDAEGEDRYRRGLYTYLKRTTPYPSFLTFDSGSGEVCQVRRIRTNTPLQALVTLNDPVFLEASGAFGKWMESIQGTLAHRIQKALERALARPVNAEETAPLAKLYDTAKRHFEAHPESAHAFLTACRAAIPEPPPTDSSGQPEASANPLVIQVPATERAAWITVASSILNLDEFLTHP